MSEREKPFVAWIGPTTWYDLPGMNRLYMSDPDPDGRSSKPVVVTPLLPDDPRPGEKWVWYVKGFIDEEVTVMGPPFGGQVPILDSNGIETHAWIASLRRPPVLKDVRLSLTPDEVKFLRQRAWSITEAEKLIARLAESLEDVTP